MKNTQRCVDIVGRGRVVLLDAREREIKKLVL